MAPQLTILLALLLLAIPISPAQTETTGTICVSVFEDNNENGIRDGSEPALSGAVVTLSLEDGMVLLSHTTANEAEYCFEGLVARAYRLSFEPGSGYTATTRDALGVDLAAGGHLDVTFGAARTVASLSAPVLVLPEQRSAASASPPEGQIIYLAYDAEGSADVVAIAPDGSVVRNLTQTPGVVEAEVDCSPDGRQIAFISDRDGTDNIYVMNVDGSDVRQLTFDNIEDGYKTSLLWRDGSNWIVALAGVTGADYHIFAVDATSGAIEPRDESAYDDSWNRSPDGTRIALHVDTDPDPDVRHFDIFIDDGSRRIQLTDDDYLDFFPDWSPDGMRLVFSSFDRAGADGEIFVINADGSGLTQLTDNDTHDSYPCWSSVPLNAAPPVAAPAAIDLEAFEASAAFDRSRLETINLDGDALPDRYVYTFEPEQISDQVTLNTELAFDTASDGLVGTMTFEFVNTSDQPTTVRHVETIPKALAAHINDLEFSTPPTEIIDADPVVAWLVNLSARASVRLQARAKTAMASVATGDPDAIIRTHSALVLEVAGARKFQRLLQQCSDLIADAPDAANGVAMQLYCARAIVVNYPERLTNDDCSHFRDLETRFSATPLEFSSACQAIVNHNADFCSNSDEESSCRAMVFKSLRTTCDVAAGEQVWVDCIQGAVKQSGFLTGCDLISSEAGNSFGAQVCYAGALEDANVCLDIEPAAAREVCCNAISNPMQNAACMDSISVEPDQADEPIIEGETLTLDEVLGSDDGGSTGDTGGVPSAPAAAADDEEFNPQSGTYMYCSAEDSSDCDPHTITFADDGKVLLLKYYTWEEAWVLTRVDERTYVGSLDLTFDDEIRIINYELIFESSKRARIEAGENGKMQLMGYFDFVE